MNEKSRPSSEDSRLKESALESKCRAPANGELPNIGTLDPTRELENQEWPNAELPNRKFLEFESLRFGLKKSLDLDKLAQEDCVWRDQLLEVNPVTGGRFERPRRPPT